MSAKKVYLELMGHRQNLSPINWQNDDSVISNREGYQLIYVLLATRLSAILNVPDDELFHLTLSQCLANKTRYELFTAFIGPLRRRVS